MSGALVFVASDKRECEPWVGHWQGTRRVDLPVRWAVQGRWGDRDAIAIANGVGAQHAAAAVEAAPEAEAFVSIGTCGALDSSLSIGDVFVPTEVRGADGNWPVPALSGPPANTGPLISVSRIAANASEKKKLRETGALAVEMEAAGVARASARRGVPFYCVRAVSDLAAEDFVNDFNAFLMPDGRFNVPRLVLSAMARPASRFPELIRLAQRTALASKNMGDFLARCSF